jgi:hypothetical protein
MSYYKVGLHNVGSYQVSGKPFVSGGVDATNAVKVEFPMVTSWVAVTNNDNGVQLKVGFSENGVSGSNYFSVYGRGTNAGASNKAPQPTVYDLKVTEIWLYGAADVDVLAGLTSISKNDINNSSNSPSSPYINWSGSAGVG